MGTCKLHHTIQLGKARTQETNVKFPVAFNYIL